MIAVVVDVDQTKEFSSVVTFITKRCVISPNFEKLRKKQRFFTVIIKYGEDGS